jgi:hypothetical protein
MAAPIDPAKVRAILADLGVQPAEMEAIRRCPLEEGKRRLDELKERVHKNYKRLAFELHPDRTGNDPEKTERFKLVGAIREDFDKLQLRAPPQFMPMPMRVPVGVVMHVPVQVVSWHARSTVTFNQTSTTVINSPFVVANMRPNS